MVPPKSSSLTRGRTTYISFDMSKLMQEVNNVLGVKRKRTSPYHPQCNGVSERIWKTVKSCLGHVVADNQSDWDDFLPFIRLAINQSWHSSINCSPAKLFLGRELMTPTDLLLPRAELPHSEKEGYAAELENRLTTAWDTARKHMKASKAIEKAYYDDKLVPANIEIGQRVLKFDPKGRKGLATKLVKHWIGPYVVTGITDTNAWIRPIGQPLQAPKCVHLNLLKGYNGPSVPPEDSQQPSDGEGESLEEPEEILNSATTLGLSEHETQEEQLDGDEATAGTARPTNERYSLRERPRQQQFPGTVPH